MDVDLVFKIAAIGILVAGLVVVLVLVIQKISELFALIKQLFSF